MVAAGLWEEVQGLLARGDLTLRTPAMRAVGYRQLAGQLQESPKPTPEQRATAELAAIAATRQLAKRQMTWIRADSDWRRVAVGAPHSPQVLAEQIAAHLSKERAAA
jgi:tRNA dimethylallyltransferase